MCLIFSGLLFLLAGSGMVKCDSVHTIKDVSAIGCNGPFRETVPDLLCSRNALYSTRPDILCLSCDHSRLM